MKIKLILRRHTYLPQSTLGTMEIWDWEGANKLSELHTLEDTVRPHYVKVKHHTAISEGFYHVDVNHSRKFNKELPYIEHVPNFSGIRIHSGNTHVDTSGCILVGKSIENNTLLESRKALAILMAHLARAEKTYIKIINLPNI